MNLVLIFFEMNIHRLKEEDLWRYKGWNLDAFFVSQPIYAIAKTFLAVLKIML